MTAGDVLTILTVRGARVTVAIKDVLATKVFPI
jgi:hypothetical protein